jgi:hypothetical protein
MGDPMKRTAFALRRVSLFAAAAVAALAQPALAQGLMSQDFIAPGDEKFVLRLGGILNQFDTSLRLDGQTVRGTDINLENNGASKQLSSFEASGTWRFLPRHRLDLGWFSAKRSGSRDYTTEIDIGGTTFPAGATVSARAKDDLLIGDYRYSFVKDPQLELAGVLGFYGGRFAYDINASGTAGNVQGSSSKSVSTTLPLPLLGVSLDWHPSPMWTFSGLLEGMKAKVGDVDGHAYVATLASEYMLVRNFGLGLRYMYSDVNADVSKGDFNGNLSWKMNSLSLYGKFMF